MSRAENERATRVIVSRAEHERATRGRPQLVSLLNGDMSRAMERLLEAYYELRWLGAGRFFD